jgi:hypothetical protein
MTTASQSNGKSSPIAKFITLALVGLIKNPVFLTALFGPLLLSLVLSSLRDQVSTLPPATSNTLLGLLNHSQLSGFVDYCIQYYTAILVTITSACYLLDHGLVDLIKGDKTSGDWTRAYQAFGLLLLVWAGYILMSSASKYSVFEIYIQNPPLLGSGSKRPPMNSWITWIRLVLGLYCVVLPYLPRLKANPE